LLIEEFDPKHNKITVRVHSVDDLYVLYSFIKPGDMVTAKTSRKVKFTEKESARVPMILTIEVQNVSFQEFAERIRIRGRILSGPEKYVSFGSYHTININLGDSLIIERPEGFTDEDLEPLKEAEKMSFRVLLLVAIEEGEATIGILSNYGLKIVATIRENTATKGISDERSSLIKRFFSNIYKVLIEIQSKYSANYIIVAGPGFIKEQFSEYLKKQPEFRNVRIITDTVTSGTVSGIHEMLKRGTPQKAVQNHRVTLETMKIEEFLMHIGKDDKLAVYGYEDVKKAIEYGAVDTLLVSMSLISTYNIDQRNKIMHLIKLAKNTRSKILIISNLHPAGKQFERIGGIAAILRYPLKG